MPPAPDSTESACTVIFDEQDVRNPNPRRTRSKPCWDFLDFQRATFWWKTSGPTTDQLGVQVAASAMTIGGVLKHLSYAADSSESLYTGWNDAVAR